MTDTLPIHDVAEGSTNPRQRFDQAKLDELAASIRAHGVLAPILVRHNGTGVEVVAGARRLRAAKLAGLTEIPVVVTKLSDERAVEVQLVENLQREDLDALEEAAGLQRLTVDHGYGVDELAKALGKSKRYVYAALQLGRLPPGAQKLYREGKLPKSQALLVSGIPDPAEQLRAAEMVATGDDGYGPPDWEGEQGTPLTVTDTERLIADRFRRALKGAPFDLAAEPACGSCPKMSKNLDGAELKKKGADVCTDVACFREKADAAHRARVAKAAKKGGREASAAELEQLARRVRPPGAVAGLVLLSEKAWAHDPQKARTWRTLLGKDAPPPVLVQEPGTFKTLELVDAKAAAQVLKQRHPELGKRQAAAQRLSPAERAAREKTALEHAVSIRALLEVVEVAERVLGEGADATCWGPIALALSDGLWADVTKQVAQRRQLASGKGGGGRGAALGRAIPSLSGPELVGLVVELVMTRAALHQYAGSQARTAWRQLAVAMGIDLAAHTRAVKQERATSAKKKTAKKAKRAKKAGGKKPAKKKAAKKAKRAKKAAK